MSSGESTGMSIKCSVKKKCRYDASLKAVDDSEHEAAGRLHIQLPHRALTAGRSPPSVERVSRIYAEASTDSQC